MVDFRKWLFALAVVGLLLGIGSSANAQGTMQCTTTAGGGVNVNIRSEGVTELVGDLIINCTGGTPTAGGVTIPLENIQISINANITSRIEDSTTGASEALMLIDSPYPATGIFPFPTAAGAVAAIAANAQTQLACQALNSVNCAEISKGVGVGAVGNYDGTTNVPAGTGPHYNVFQGYTAGVNSIAWNGVPIDAPGTAGNRIIRIVNVRANAFALGVSSTLIPTQISMIVSVNGNAVINLSQPSNGNVVATVLPGLTGTTTAVSYQQCNNLNATLLNGTGGVTDGGITVTATEGFAASFKTQNFTQFFNVSANVTGGPTLGTYTPPGTGVNLQNIPGFNYNSESGFYPGGGIGLDETAAEPVGLADRGTQIQFTVAGVPSGVSLFAPSYVYMTGPYGVGQTVGVGVLLSSSTTPAGPTVSHWTGTAPDMANGANIPVTLAGTTATLVYEVYYADPSVQESLAVPITAAWITTGPTNPTPTTTPVTAAVNFSPLSAVGTASSTAPIPRFGQPHAALPLFSINACSCNLLFPFVTQINGFDTGVAIANTTADTLNGLAPQSGTVTLTYYGTTAGGGAAPPTQTTTSAVPAGSELIFTLSSGGNYGIASTPGFEGYMIARANFQYCHGYAFISDVGATRLAQGYLAISLDVPVVTVNPLLPTGLNRTGNAGENEGH